MSELALVRAVLVRSGIGPASGPALLSPRLWRESGSLEEARSDGLRGLGWCSGREPRRAAPRSLAPRLNEGRDSPERWEISLVAEPIEPDPRPLAKLRVDLVAKMIAPVSRYALAEKRAAILLTRAAPAAELDERCLR